MLHTLFLLINAPRTDKPWRHAPKLDPLARRACRAPVVSMLCNHVFPGCVLSSPSFSGVYSTAAAENKQTWQVATSTRASVVTPHQPSTSDSNLSTRVDSIPPRHFCREQKKKTRLLLFFVANVCIQGRPYLACAMFQPQTTVFCHERRHIEHDSWNVCTAVACLHKTF